MDLGNEAYNAGIKHYKIADVYKEVIPFISTEFINLFDIKIIPYSTTKSNLFISVFNIKELGRFYIESYLRYSIEDIVSSPEVSNILKLIRTLEDWNV